MDNLGMSIFLFIGGVGVGVLVMYLVLGVKFRRVVLRYFVNREMPSDLSDQDIEAMNAAFKKMSKVFDEASDELSDVFDAVYKARKGK